MKYYILNNEGVCVQIINSEVELKEGLNIVKSHQKELGETVSHLFNRYDRDTGEWSIPVDFDKYFINNEITKLDNVKAETSSINTTTTMTSEDALLLMEMMLDIQKQLAKLNPTV